MKASMRIRFHSGREERFKAEFIAGGGAGWRLNEFLSNPTVSLRTESELLIFPAAAIECISISLPPQSGQHVDLSNVRMAERIT